VPPVGRLSYHIRRKPQVTFVNNLLEELTKFSPVFDIVSNPVPVSIQIERR
jgi:hypothetical protein